MTKKTSGSSRMKVYYSCSDEATGEDYMVDISNVIETRTDIQRNVEDQTMCYTFTVIAPKDHNVDYVASVPKDSPNEDPYSHIDKLVYEKTIFDPQQIHKFRKETLQVLKDYGYTIMHTSEYDRMIKRLDALETLQHELEKID